MTAVYLFLYPLSLLLAALVGFAAQRASVCTVRAVAEVLSTRRAYFFLSFAKTVLWVMVVTSVLGLMLPSAAMPVKGEGTVLVAASTGGFLFGMGAALNGACAFSTLSRLGAGELGMLFTFTGFSAALLGYVLLDVSIPPSNLVSASSAPVLRGPWLPVLAGALSLWGGFELWRLWRSRPAGAGAKDLLLAPRYRLSTGAAVIGISAGTLYVLHGAWAYTGTLAESLQWAIAASGAPALIDLTLFAALLAGVAVSAWQRGAFRLRLPSPGHSLRYLLGGLLMGLGWALVPGGNFVLILHSIPMLLPHAVPAYGALVLGVATPLLLMGLVKGTFMKVDCSGDLCSSE